MTFTDTDIGTPGIANVGFALAAWITDPFGTVGLLQPIPTGG